MYIALLFMVKRKLHKGFQTILSNQNRLYQGSVLNIFKWVCEMESSRGLIMPNNEMTGDDGDDEGD